MTESAPNPPADSASSAGVVRTHMPAWLGDLFEVDLRSLAAMRIGLGLCLLADVYNRCHYLTDHYTDAGVLPRSARLAVNELGDTCGVYWWWGIHMLSGNWWYQAALFAVMAVFALWLTVGYRTRLAAVACWFLVMSLQARNPMVLQGGDLVFRCLLLWCMFVPLGAAWSVDALLAKSKNATTSYRPPRAIVTIAAAALLLQLCVMYWFTAALKVDPAWRTDFSAVYYALHMDHFTTTFGQWMRAHPSICWLLTLATWLLEWVGPFLLFVPIINRHMRVAVPLAFIGLHLGLVATMHLGLFPWICIVYWLAFFPGEFWDRLAPTLRKLSVRFIPNRALTRLASLFRRPELPRLAPSRASSLVAFSLAMLVLALNVRRLDFSLYAPVAPGPVEWVTKMSGLDQCWCMFAPRPCGFGGWLVMKGTLADGREVNLWQPDEPIPYEKPTLVSAMYPAQRWRKCAMNLFEGGFASHRRNFADYLRRRWNATHPPEEQVGAVEIVLMKETTPPVGEPFTPAVPETLIRWDYTRNPTHLAQLAANR